MCCSEKRFECEEEMRAKPNDPSCKTFCGIGGNPGGEGLLYSAKYYLRFLSSSCNFPFSVNRYHFAVDQFDRTQCSGDLFNRKPTFGSKTMCAQRPRPICQHILATPIKISLAVTVWREQVQLNRIPVLPSTSPIARMRRFTNRKIFSQKISRQLETSAMSRTKTKLMELIRWKLLDVRFLANNQSPITNFWFIPVT